MLSFKQINVRSENFREVPKLPVGLGEGTDNSFLHQYGAGLGPFEPPCYWTVSLINILELVWSFPSSC